MSPATLARWADRKGPWVFRPFTVLVMVLALLPVLLIGAATAFAETYPTLWQALRAGRRL